MRFGAVSGLEYKRRPCSDCRHDTAPYNFVINFVLLLLLLGRVALEAQRPIVVKLSRGRSVGLSVRASVCRSVGRSHGLSSACGKTADRIRMPFGIIGQTGPWMRQIWGSVHGKGYFGGEFGARHCNQWGLYVVCVRQRRHAALFPNYFGQTCYYY